MWTSAREAQAICTPSVSAVDVNRDGCIDVSRSPDLYVNERAREIAPVRMTGNYGDEVLRFIDRVLEDGLRTPDLATGADGEVSAGTDEMTLAVLTQLEAAGDVNTLLLDGLGDVDRLAGAERSAA